MSQLSSEMVLAIDFGLDRLDVALRDGQGQWHWPHRAYDNNQTGCQTLCEDLQAELGAAGDSRLTVVGEATGAYWWHAYHHLGLADALAAYQPQLLLFNAKHVKHFRRALPERNKTDRDDPALIDRYYRANPDQHPYQPQPRYQQLRFLTRAYFRLIHTLAAQKAAAAATIYLLASEYQRQCPFSNLFGVTAQKVLDAFPNLSELAEMPVADLVAQLRTFSANSLPNPQDTAQKLLSAAEHSYRLPDQERQTLQTIRQLSLAHIRFLEGQQKTYQQLIQQALDQLPEAQLALAERGLGPVLVAGILAEIGDTRRFITGMKFDRKRKRYRPRRYRDGQAAIAKMAGLWWPTDQSGRRVEKKSHLAQERNAYLRFWLTQAAYTLQRYRPDYAAFYWSKYTTATKNPNQRALVLTARKATRLLFALLHKGQRACLEEVKTT